MPRNRQLVLMNPAESADGVVTGEMRALGSLATRLGMIKSETRSAPLGPVSIVLMGADLPGEVELALPEPFPVTPQVIGALKAVQGVVHVEEY